MKKIISLLAVGGAIVVAASCGDNLKAPSDAKTADSGSNGSGSGFPAAPTLGAQIDRMGRPAINTALNNTFNPSAAAAGSAKDAYNADEAVGMWPQHWAATFMPNLAVFDVLDRGITCTNGVCTADVAASGCGNQAFFNGNPSGGGSATATSYLALAGVLADDELFLDTSKGVADVPGTHQNYLAAELNGLVGIPNPTCGGRAPTNDVIDTSYSLLAVGINGFNAGSGFDPAFKDGAGPHADVSNDTFPFLGSAH